MALTIKLFFERENKFGWKQTYKRTTAKMLFLLLSPDNTQRMQNISTKMTPKIRQAVFHKLRL